MWGTILVMRSALNVMFNIRSLGQSGATALEYAMVAFFISIAAFGTLVTIGSDVSGLFSRIAGGF
ncbi:MAG TPA: Flp family type IVb pilin [Stellaceae bacterium]|nr:Flp family type IVb pilin [Stellaceae bacterium]